MVFGNSPWYIWIIVLIGVIGMPALTAIVLRRIGLAFAVVWAAWIVLSFVLAAQGAYRADPVKPALGLPLALLGSFGVLFAIAFIPAVQRILAPERLVWPQVFRPVGGVFLVALALGQLPAVFAIPAGLGDIAVGISAIFVARRASRRLVWFNVLGITDLVVAVTIGFLAGQGPFQLLHVTPSTSPLTELPLALIPTTGVSLALALHVTSLRLLRR